MQETWRWFGPQDRIELHEIRQTGARGIVNALHEIPYGEVWSEDAIRARQAIIAADPALGLRWQVVESLPLHEGVKLGDGDLSRIFDAYRQSLRNLAACGIEIVCYNFMPLLDWTRTQLAEPLPGGGSSLRFNMHEYVAFDVFMLERPGAADGLSPELLARAKAWFDASDEAARERLLGAIMAGLPGAYERYDVPGLREVLKRYDGISREDVRANFRRFLEEVIPTAEEVGIRLCVHPDDPPRSLFGLPRVVSDADDIAFVLDCVDSTANGLTLCSGSLGANPANDVPAIAARFAERIHFAHLRNVTKDADGSFEEADHLGGDNDMVALIRVLLAEERRRMAAGRADWEIPMRPDHGHELLSDVGRGTHPGYPLIGRLRGLAELRGVIAAVNAIDGAAA
ncbi:MAG: mannonate dehydratase [Aurantimonas endophytica]|uniref:Mannonate dehydratase n=1 Tax=Aurantimonas endophytica TaxID=1522175 RepID=A0A7W6HGG7_9HYPH|nr:mannonate dehydratase [Aurantimonas endophytica]MBB4004498.1 mannonate dehydratase [Aurantimonas endophytica]MCO6405334.1 mannonate dehydratase [Aurantimonas endophytica]